jgi:dTDP-4-dehydrorhamnose 3,5-epimerase
LQSQWKLHGYIVQSPVFDYIGSLTYGMDEIYELSTSASNAVYLPRGIAHGFCVRAAPAVMVYHVSSEHDPARDAGIHWNSFGVAWPIDSPVVSARDNGFIGFKEFRSPFLYSASDAAPIGRDRGCGSIPADQP